VTRIYSIKPADGGVVLDQVWSQAQRGLAAGYTALVPVQVGGTTALYAYDKATQQTDVYTLTGDAPGIQPAKARVDLLGGHAWDSVTTFVLGNEPYLMTYEAAHGTFGFFRVAGDLTVSKPYSFVLPRNTPTRGFSTVAAYTSLGQITFTGYSFDTGIVANFSLAVTSSSTGGVPALLAQNVWYHQWAKGWTRFAFFQLGGANFFFKINTAKLNVNIDHMQDNPAMGSVEVGSYLQSQLPDALSITHAAHVPWADGEPYLLTYIASSGATVVYRIHADCQGWTSLDACTTEPGATQVIPYRIGDVSYALFYQAP
jgi:hypothetical protein